ncbi:GAF domain-containing protein [Cellulomonas sp. NS3]|uniref:GAF domain-containing protein n=1 Tax=Cellulomonas sp. NS3 TaxID=2973977 RepID=UPI0021623497|nr:GAF domain-containing protein [Cellulomonas sp. NS3]
MNANVTVAPADALLAEEPRSLQALDRYGLVHSFDGPEYDDLVELARDVTGAPYVSIGLVLPDEGVVKACVGDFIATFQQAESFTAVTIQDRLEPTVVPDMTRDVRFAANPYVTGAVKMRAYMGTTLSSIGDEPLGALEIMDTSAREWTPQQVRHLIILGRMVEAHFELRRVLHEAVLNLR